MIRLDILNQLAAAHNYQTYLEIGVEKGHVFRNVNCPKRVGVEPEMLQPLVDHLAENPTDVVYNMTSDEAFNAIDFLGSTPFDLIFIDGLHTKEQLVKDVLNSLHHLAPGGTIVCHDMLPTEEVQQLVPRQSDIWTGNIWRGWLQLRATRPDLRMVVLDHDWGCGIIQRGKQTKGIKICFTADNLTWQQFLYSRNMLMPVVNEIPEEFLQ